jgi:hypothetical protein
VRSGTSFGRGGRFARFRASDALAQELRNPALGFARRLDGERVVSAIAINLARFFGDERWRERNIGLIGWSGLDRADDPVSLSVPKRLLLSPLEAEPITVASISVPLRTQAPFLSRSPAMAANRF